GTGTAKGLLGAETKIAQIGAPHLATPSAITIPDGLLLACLEVEQKVVFVARQVAEAGGYGRTSLRPIAVARFAIADLSDRTLEIALQNDVHHAGDRV